MWAARLVLAIANAAQAIHPSANLSIIEHAHVERVDDIMAPSAPSGASCGVGAAATGAGGVGAAGPAPGVLLHVRMGEGRDVTQVRAGAVVHCTNAYAAGLLPELSAAVKPTRNQVRVPEVWAGGPGQGGVGRVRVEARGAHWEGKRQRCGVAWGKVLGRLGWLGAYSVCGGGEACHGH